MSAKPQEEIPDYIKSDPIYVETMENLSEAYFSLESIKMDLDRVKAKKTSVTYWKSVKEKDIRKFEKQIEIVEEYIKEGVEKLEKWIEQEKKKKAKGGRRRSRRRKSRRKSKRRKSTKKKRRRRRR